MTMHELEDYRDEDRKKGRKNDEVDDEADDDEAALELGKLEKNPLAEEQKIEEDIAGDD